MADIERIMGCLSTQLTILGGMAVHLTPEGGMDVELTPRGGMAVTLAPVCAVDLGPLIPPNALLTVDGIPFITSDGYYLIVVPS